MRVGIQYNLVKRHKSDSDIDPHIAFVFLNTRKTFRPVSMAATFEAHVSITTSCAPRMDFPLFKTNVVDSGESSKGFSKNLTIILGLWCWPQV
jgi:hypothetical protein